MKQTLAQNTDNNSKYQLSKKRDGSNSSKWPVKKLGEVCEFQRGLTYSKRDEVEFSDNIVLRSNNVDLLTKNLDFTELKYINPEIHIPENKKVKKGSLLICTANGSKSHLGKVALIDEDYNYAFGGFMGLLTPKKELYSKLLFYLMTSENYKNFIDKLSDGANINNLKFSDLEKFPIPLPPLTEQKRIVAILDEAFGEIEKVKVNTEQNLKNAKELFQSYLQGVFENKGDDWDEKKLGEIGSPKMCKRIFKEQTKTEGDIPFYKIGTFGKEPDAFISKEIYDEFRLKYSFPKKGDILISASGTIGRCIRYDGKPAYFQDSNIVWIDNDEKHVLNDFLFEFYGVCNWGSTKGATISRLYNDNLKNIKISFPKSLTEQKDIVQRLDALRAETQRLESIYRDKLLNLEELKKSILQKAFSGEL